MDTTQHTNTQDTRAQNQEAADEFYRQLDAARPARIAAILREGARSAELDIIVRDSTRWRNARSRLDAQRRRAAAGRKVDERDRARYARTQRRHYVTAMTRSQLPPPRLGPTLTQQQKQRNNVAYWAFVRKTQSPSDGFRRRVSRDADSNYPLWILTHSVGGPVSTEEINRFRAQYLKRKPITAGRIKRNEIRPVGISLERALEIAAAALDRKDL
jgi:transcriptional regulator NrdR family protein